MIVTITPSATDADTCVEADGPVEDFAAALVPVEGEKDGPAFIPARLKVPHRLAVNVAAVTALVADVDHVTPAEGAALVARVTSGPYRAITYETYSHSEAEWCFRVVWPFASEFSVASLEAWRKARAALLKHVGFASESDPACSDPCRLYFLPRHPPGEHRDMLDHPGELLDWSRVVGAVGGGAPTPARASQGPDVAVGAVVAPTGSIPSGPVLERVRAKLEKVGRGVRPAARAVAALVAGTALAPHGHRHRAWLQATGVLADVLHGEGPDAVAAGVEVLHLLGGPSRDAEMTASPDAPHPWEHLEKMLETALSSAATRAETRERELETLRRIVRVAGTPAEVGTPGETAEDDIVAKLMAPLSESERQALTEALRDPCDAQNWPELFSEAMHPAALFLMHLGGWRVLRGAGQVLAVRFVENAEEQLVLEQMKLTALKDWLAPHKVQVGTQRRSLVTHWLESRHTPRYDGLITSATKHPRGYLNLWQGLAAAPKAGDVGPARELFRHLAGDSTPEYLWRWCAWAAQNPTERAEVAVVLKGPEGCGKGTLARLMTSIFGPHGVQLHRREELVGRFNSILVGKCFVVADECTILSDAEADVLKSVVTEPILTTEGKNKDVLQYPNPLKLMILTNRDHALSVDAGRRYVIYDCDPFHADADSADDRAYWEGLNRWIDGGGREAFLAELLALDLRGWHPRNRPVTSGLQRERAASLKGAKGWLHHVLTVGGLRGLVNVHEINDRPIEGAKLIEDAAAWAKARGQDPPTPIGLGKLLSACGAVRSLGGPRRLAQWTLDVIAMRATFAAHVRVDAKTLGFEET